MIYTAINIGPIVHTLSLARKPRELWAASYLFSYLMHCIYDEVERLVGEDSIISPAKFDLRDDRKFATASLNARAVGLYPDRIYFKSEVDIKEVYDNVKRRITLEHTEIPFEYFNIMAVSCETDKDASAINALNRKLDTLELFNVAPSFDAEEKIVQLLKANTEEDGRSRAQSRLFEIATGESTFEMRTLRQIARAGRQIQERSYDRYVCIVRADGDNVGKAVSNPSLPEGSVKTISQSLLDFGKRASIMIDGYGGMPLYAGGDDLLFIAPVVGNNPDENIFTLIEKLDEEAFEPVRKCIPNASLSFGVSCHFVKYPLYEMLQNSNYLLFGLAKHWHETMGPDGRTVSGPKNTIAWNLRKHSGGDFAFTFSMKDQELMPLLQKLIRETTDSELISSVAHKIRQNEDLLKIILHNEPGRLDAFFERTLEFQDSVWFNTVKQLIPILYRNVGGNELTPSLYGMLRTAKFVRGESVTDDLIDE